MLSLVSNPKRLCILFLLLVFYLPAQGLAQQTVIVNTDILNVRDKPWGDRIGRVYQGQQFLIRERQGTCGRITYKTGQKGWISLDYTRQCRILY